MPYTAEIIRDKPSCFLFLVDQSGSMDDPFGVGDGITRKKDGAVDALNRLLANLVIRCSKAEGVRYYFDVGVIGYGAVVGPAFAGPLAGRDLVPISEVADGPARVEDRLKKVPDGAGGLVEQQIKFPVWLDPVANGPTPMCQALRLAYSTCQRWVDAHPLSYPPTVINITDGEATDGDPTQPAMELMSLSTQDGNVLLFNCHLSSERAPAIEFPDAEPSVPDKYAALLYRISSVLPAPIRSAAQAEGYRVSDGTRGYVFNADMVSLIKFLDIGTRASNLR